MPDIEQEAPPSIDAQFFKEALEANKEDIKAHVRKVILDGITRQFQWELPQVIQKQVTVFMETEIAPEIQRQLVADKHLIAEAATKAVTGIALEVGLALQKSVATTLSKSYEVQKIGKALFGGY